MEPSDPSEAEIGGNDDTTDHSPSPAFSFGYDTLPVPFYFFKISLDTMRALLGKRNLEWQGRLGHGSFGTVVKAKHQTDECDYAVKLIPCIDGEKYQKRKKYRKRELRLLTEQVELPITHKNIVKYYDSWKCGETTPPYLCIRMELCDSNLETLLREEQNVVDNPQFYQTIFPQILSGLEYLHKIHWVHRDIHPSNILLAIPEYDSQPHRSTPKVVVKIADFGLARKLDEESLTASDPPEEVLSVVGNRLYRAPEMKCEIDRDPEYDYKVDLYSAGLVLYRLCRRFEGSDVIQSELESIKDSGLVDKHKLSHNDKLLHQLLDNLLEKNPKKRFSASQALACFEKRLRPVVPDPQPSTSSKGFPLCSETDGPRSPTDGPRSPADGPKSPTDGPRTLKVLARKSSSTSYVRVHEPCPTSYDALVTWLIKNLKIDDIESFNIIEESDSQRITDNRDWETLLTSAEKRGKVKLVVEPKSEEKPDLC